VQARLEEEGEGLEKSGQSGGAIQEAEAVLLRCPPLRGRRGEAASVAEATAAFGPSAERAGYSVFDPIRTASRTILRCNVHLQAKSYRSTGHNNCNEFSKTSNKETSQNSCALCTACSKFHR
jgi:hypothetical protein